MAQGKYGTSVQGFAQLQRALGRIEDGSQAELRARIRDIGQRVALVAAGNAPVLKTRPSDTSGVPGELQHSIKVGVNARGASVYSSAVYGGAINFGAWSKGRGPHISRSRASHYMDRAVTETQPYVQKEMETVLDWVQTTFERDGA